MTRLTDLLREAARVAGPALFDRPATEALAALPSTLDGLFGWVMLECRVSDDARVDVIAHADVSRLRSAPPGRFAQWPAMVSAVTALSRRGAGLDGIGLLTVEIDHRQGRWQSPIVFAALEPAIGRAPPEQGRRLTEDWLRSIGEPQPAALRRVLDALPAAAWVLHVASTAPRGVAGARIVASLPTEEIGSFVARAGWEGDSSQVDELARRLGASLSRMSVHLDVGAALGPRVGLEVLHPGPPATDRRWAPAFELLTSLHSEKAEALARWPHREGDMPRLLGIKFTIERDGSVGAKAYLACCAV